MLHTAEKAAQLPHSERVEYAEKVSPSLVVNNESYFDLAFHMIVYQGRRKGGFQGFQECPFKYNDNIEK